MSFNEKPNLRDERTPLIQNPIVWTRSQEYNLDSDYSFGRKRRKEQFQWIVFIGVTIISFFILLAVIGAAMRANEMLPPVVPRPLVRTTIAPISSPTTTTTTTTTAGPPIDAVSTSTTSAPAVVENEGTLNTNSSI